MQGSEVCTVLREKRISRLYHSNTVTTSCTFLELGGLASRGYVEDRGLSQTPQYSDADDKRFGIWHDVFMDTVDIHNRIGERNKYGPVQFSIPVEALKALPKGSEILVTKKNPTKWINGEAESDRFFLTADELRLELIKGQFDQAVVLRTKASIVPFAPGEQQLTLDDPNCRLSSGEQAFTWSVDRLTGVALPDHLTVSVGKRRCRPNCQCRSQHAELTDLENYFR